MRWVMRQYVVYAPTGITSMEDSAHNVHLDIGVQRVSSHHVLLARITGTLVQPCLPSASDVHQGTTLHWQHQPSALCVAQENFLHSMQQLVVLVYQEPMLHPLGLLPVKHAILANIRRNIMLPIVASARPECLLPCLVV